MLTMKHEFKLQEICLMQLYTLECPENNLIQNLFMKMIMPKYKMKKNLHK